MSFFEVMSDSSFLYEIVSDMKFRWSGNVESLPK